MFLNTAGEKVPDDQRCTFDSEKLIPRIVAVYRSSWVHNVKAAADRQATSSGDADSLHRPIKEQPEYVSLQRMQLKEGPKKFVAANAYLVSTKVGSEG